MILKYIKKFNLKLQASSDKQQASRMKPTGRTTTVTRNPNPPPKAPGPWLVPITNQEVEGTASGLMKSGQIGLKRKYSKVDSWGGARQSRKGLIA